MFLNPNPGTPVVIHLSIPPFLLLFWTNIFLPRTQFTAPQQSNTFCKVTRSAGTSRAWQAVL